MTRTKKASKLLTFSILYGAPGAIRTPDRLVRSQVLYPTELQAHENITKPLEWRRERDSNPR